MGVQFLDNFAVQCLDIFCGEDDAENVELDFFSTLFWKRQIICDVDDELNLTMAISPLTARKTKEHIRRTRVVFNLVGFA